uniref:Coatomer subunit zeta n=2 Tax=Percomorphaceae TaxID=1489872 RepID=A0A665TTL8_ECHNA
MYRLNKFSETFLRLNQTKQKRQQQKPKKNKRSKHLLCLFGEKNITERALCLTITLEPSLYTVKAVLILDNDGDRLYAKYYDDTYPTVKEQKAFEKNIFNKTHRTDSEIALLEGLTVVYKSNIDLFFYVIGSSHENELMLMAVLNCLFDSLSQMLRKNVERRALLENMEGLFLAVDEIVDGGVILESDPQQVVHRVALRGDDVPLTEQTVTQVLQSAKEQIKWSLLR